jgi:hypothetical protein
MSLPGILLIVNVEVFNMEEIYLDEVRMMEIFQEGTIVHLENGLKVLIKFESVYKGGE